MPEGLLYGGYVPDRDFRDGMDDLDREEIKQAVHAVLDERDGLDRERHRDDHEWVYERRQREQLRTQRREILHDKIKATLIGGLLLLIVGGVLTAHAIPTL